MSNKPQKTQSNTGAVRCSTCGRFMRRLKLLERVRLEAECGLKRTHICKYETITYSSGEVVHE